MDTVHAMQIREATPDDYARIGELTLAAYRALPEPPPASYEAVLGDVAGRVRDGGIVLVAGDDRDGVIGSVTLMLDDGPFFEHRYGVDGDAGFRMLAVDPAAEGRGAARALLNACIERARAAERTRIVISSMPAMTRAHALYERAGFVRRPDLDLDFRVAVGRGYALDL